VVDCYPSKIKEGATYPAAVYEPVGVDWFGDEDYKLFKTDKMVVTIKAHALSELVALIDAIEARILTEQPANAFTAIELADVALGIEAERDMRIGALEIDITTFNGGVQSLPAAYVYQSNQSAEPMQSCANRQTHTYLYEVLSVALASEVDANRETLRTALVGYSSSGWPAEYVQGKRLANIGRYAVWRDSYQIQSIKE